jgi:hypothetical protein
MIYYIQFLDNVSHLKEIAVDIREKFILGIFLAVIFAMILKVLDAAYGLDILKTPGLSWHTLLTFTGAFLLGVFLRPVIEAMVASYMKK